MFCEIGAEYGFVAMWMTMNVLGWVSMMVLSSIVFFPLYYRPTFETWQWKCNPRFPSPALIKKEIVQMTKGMVVATLIPAFAIKLSASSKDSSIGFKGYCGANPVPGAPIDWAHLALEVCVILAYSEFFEYAYHWCGHYFTFLWTIHKHHHAFYNPSPFAVIADEWLDQFVRTTPLVVLPLLMDINMDLLFAIFTLLFYGYGVYLHCGYEMPGLSAHQWIFNTSYHHYTHHAISVKNRPIYTGFFIKLWDHLFDTGYDKCTCIECRPKRTLAEYNATEKPDYSVLLTAAYWRNLGETPVEFMEKKSE